MYFSNSMKLDCKGWIRHKGIVSKVEMWSNIGTIIIPLFGGQSLFIWASNLYQTQLLTIMLFLYHPEKREKEIKVSAITHITSSYLISYHTFAHQPVLNNTSSTTYQ